MKKKKKQQSVRGFATTSVPPKNKDAPNATTADDRPSIPNRQSDDPSQQPPKTPPISAAEDASIDTAIDTAIDANNTVVSILAISAQERSTVRARVDAKMRQLDARLVQLDSSLLASSTFRLDAQSEALVARLLADLSIVRDDDWVRMDRTDASLSQQQQPDLASLLATYLTLEKMGFTPDQCERAMTATRGRGAAERCMDWLCYSLTPDELPSGFTDKMGGGDDDEDGSAAGGITLHAVAERQQQLSSVAAGSENERSTMTTPARAAAAASPKKDSAEKTSSKKTMASIDAQTKSRILNLAGDMDDEEDDIDIDIDRRKREEEEANVPVHVEHARLRLRTDSLRALIKRGSTGGVDALKRELKGALARIKDIESQRTWGKVKGKAEVEYAKGIAAGLDAIDLPPPPPPPIAKETHSKNEKVGDEEDEGDDEGDAGLDGLAAMMTMEDDTTTKKHVNTIVAPIRSLSVPKSWTGKTPRIMLREYCARVSKGAKAVFRRIDEAQRGVYRCAVRLEGVPGFSEFVMDPSDRVDSLAIAEEFVATIALIALTASSNMPLYRSLPPDFRDLWLEIRNRAGDAEAQRLRESEERRVNFVKALHDATTSAARQSTQLCAEESATDSMTLIGEGDASSNVGSAAVAATEEWLQRALNAARASRQYDTHRTHRHTLPITAHRSEIISLLSAHQTMIVAGDTGSGKSTQVPQFILKHAADTLTPVHVLIAQPRRVSAVSIADRVEAELCMRGGGVVAHAVRLDSTVTRSTRLTFCTLGVLLRRIERDVALKGVTHVIVDEVHERNIDTDFLLLVLRRRVLPVRPDLRVVLMSATADPAKFQTMFAPPGAVAPPPPVVTVGGRMYPVRAFFLEDVVERIGYVLDRGSEYERRDVRAAAEVGTIVVGRGAAKRVVAFDATVDGGSSAAVIGVSQRAVGFDDDDDDDEDDADDDTRVVSSSRVKEFSAVTIDTINRMDMRQTNLELVEALVRWVVDESSASMNAAAAAANDDEDEANGVLVFLPGIAEIRRLLDRLSVEAPPSSSTRGNRGRGRASSSLFVLPLHSTVSPEEQSRVFRPPPRGMTKVVLATNIAETGITIPDIVHVIDTCRAREVSYDEKRHITRLTEVLISKANCKQRRGRAGRVRPGTCYHLITNDVYESLPEHRPPEMLRMPLEELVLRGVSLLTRGNELSDTTAPVDIAGLLAGAMDPPPEKHVERAITVLRQIKALTPLNRLTPLGNRLALLPLDARLGKMLIYAAALRCLDPLLTVAACLSLGREPYARRFDDVGGSAAASRPSRRFRTVDSDLLAMATAYAGWRAALLRSASEGRDYILTNSLSFTNLQQIEEARGQLVRLLVESGCVGSDALLPKKERLAYPLLTLIPPKYSANATPPILLSTIAAGLYPSILHLPASQQQLNNQVLHPPNNPNDSVLVHRGCILPRPIAPGWFSAHSVTRTERARIVARDLNRVGLLGVCVAAGDAVVEHRLRVLSLDGGRVLLRCSPRTAVMLKLFIEAVKRGVEGSDERSIAVDQTLALLIKLLENEGKSICGMTVAMS